jgi:very-short-patch-repair endonuclease
MAAVLACGPQALLSHRSAAALWGLRDEAGGRPIDVSVPATTHRRHPGIRTHRRADLRPAERHRIPVTDPVATIVDIAPLLSRDDLEGAVNEADRLDLIDPDALREALDQLTSRPGLAKTRSVLDRRTFTVTDTHLERLFLPIARRAGLPPPLTQVYVNGFRVDFHWPDLGLVVETDGLQTHRTPAQQAKDRVRDQAHAAAGLTPLRFTRAQVRFEPEYVERILTEVVRRLAGTSRVTHRTVHHAHA